MTRRPICLGPLGRPGEIVLRSGLSWLLPDGESCNANQIIAYCNIALPGSGGHQGWDLQVALAPKFAGTVRHGASLSRGGYLDRLSSCPWHEDEVWAAVENPAGDVSSDVAIPNLLFLAGRRYAGIAGNRHGLLPGWHDSIRAWWGEGDRNSLLAAGVCELDPILAGDDRTFGNLFEKVAGPVHLSIAREEPLVPCAAILAEQIARSPREIDAIRDDLMQAFGSGRHAPTSADWVFIGALLRSLETHPLLEEFELIGSSGFSDVGPPAAVCLSLSAELAAFARHRRLGYTLNLHGFRAAEISPAVHDWLRTHFEVVQRCVDDVEADYRRLFEAAPDRQFFIVNRVSSQQNEDIQSYADFDEGTIARLSSLRAKELNLMLHDLERGWTNIAIVDADAIAAEMGMFNHLPDGIHGSGAFYAELQSELVRLMQERRFAGFDPRTITRS